MKKYSKAIALGLVMLATTNIAFAQIDNLASLFVVSFTGDIFDVLAGIINWVVAIAGIVAFVFLLIGGFEYLTAGGDSEKVSKGRTTITNAIIGLVIVALAFLLTRVVVQNLGSNENTDPQGTFYGGDIQ